MPKIYGVLCTINDHAKIFISDLKKFMGSLFHEESVKKSDWAWILLIFLCAVGYRIYFVFTKPMGYDETLTYLYFASKPINYIISNYWNPSNHIFHTVWVHVFYKLFGRADPWVLRMPAFISGCLVLVLAYVVSRAFYKDKKAALWHWRWWGSRGVRFFIPPIPVATGF